MHDRSEGGQKKNLRNRKSSKYSKSSHHKKNDRFDLTALQGKPLRKGKGKTRVSWKSRKVELEQMDIDDLKDYLLETEY